MSEESGGSLLGLSLLTVVVLRLMGSYFTDDTPEPQRNEMGRVPFLGPPVY